MDDLMVLLKESVQLADQLLGVSLSFLKFIIYPINFLVKKCCDLWHINKEALIITFEVYLKEAFISLAVIGIGLDL